MFGSLAGIGLGGGLYSLFARRRPPTLEALAWTAILEALWVAGSYPAGDRIAIPAALFRPVGVIGGCYLRANDPRAVPAEEDLLELRSETPAPFVLEATPP